MIKVARVSGKSAWEKAAVLLGCNVEFQDVAFGIDVYTDDPKDVDRLIRAQFMLCEVVSGHDEKGEFIGLVRKYTEDQVKEACQ